MFNSSDVFTIAGYDDDGFSSGKKEFVLQINPEKFDIIVGDKNPAPGKKADGDRLVSGAPGKEILKWNFSFLIDNTGVLPRLPTGCSTAGSSIAPSIEALRDACVSIRNATHTKPFVEAIWADLSIQGRVSKISARYEFFDNKGNPLRSFVTIEITAIAKENPNLQSPDISRMPTMKDGDNLVKFCEDYYKDKNYYIKIAALNNMSSFRAIEKGKRLEFPPIKK